MPASSSTSAPYPGTPNPYPATVPSNSGAAPDRRESVILLWCAAASLGLLFLKSSGSASLASNLHAEPGLFRAESVFAYLHLLAPALGLLAWHWKPRRVAGWLLLAGVVCAAPLTILSMRSGSYDPDLLTVIFVLSAAAPAFTLIGVLSAATVGWRQGLRGPAVSLIGAAVVIQLVGPVVLASSLGESALWGMAGAGTIRTLTIVLLAVAAAGAVVAVVRSARYVPAFEGRPPWSVTLAGAVVAAAQALQIAWQPNLDGFRDGSIGDHYLYIGLAFLAIGVLVSAIGGLRVLAAAAGVGLLIGVFGVLLAPSVEVMAELPVLAVVAGLGSLLAGAAIAISPYRARIGTTGLWVVGVGLLALFFVTNTDDPYLSYRGALLVMTPILLVIGIITAVCAVASIGAALSDRLETPAVLAGMTTAFSSGAAALCGYFAVQHRDGRARIVDLLPPTTVGLFLAAGLVAVVAFTLPGPAAPGWSAIGTKPARSSVTTEPGPTDLRE